MRKLRFGEIKPRVPHDQLSSSSCSRQNKGQRAPLSHKPTAPPAVGGGGLRAAALTEETPAVTHALGGWLGLGHPAGKQASIRTGVWTGKAWVEMGRATHKTVGLTHSWSPWGRC